MTDATRGRPPGPAAFWASTYFATVLVELDGFGTVRRAPPIVAWSVGKRFTEVHRWALRKDRDARFAWVDADGTVGEVW